MFHVVVHFAGPGREPARVAVAAIDPWTIRLDGRAA